MKKWNKYEILWLMFSIFLIIAAIIYKGIYIENSNTFLNWLSNISAVCGVIYVFGIAKQMKFAYFFGIINVILYAVVCRDKGLYMSSFYNLFYSCPMMIYGYFYWSKNKNQNYFGVKALNTAKRFVLGIIMILVIFIVSGISKYYFDGENVILDSAVSVCVCVATFFMARKYIEQWFLFIIANFIGVIMFSVISFNGMSNIELLLMWGIYLMNSIYGAISWRKAYLEEKE